MDFQCRSCDLTGNLNPSNNENHHNRNAVNDQHPDLNSLHVIDVIITYEDNKVLHDCDCVEHVLHENIKLINLQSISFPR